VLLVFFLILVLIVGFVTYRLRSTTENSGVVLLILLTHLLC